MPETLGILSGAQILIGLIIQTERPSRSVFGCAWPSADIPSTGHNGAIAIPLIFRNVPAGAAGINVDFLLSGWGKV